MYHLLKKDLLISKRYLVLTFLATGVCLYLISEALEGLPLAFWAASLSYFLIVSTNKADEKNNNGRMLASLPVRRLDIITAKYVGIIMFYAIIFLFTIFWRVLWDIIFPQSQLPWLSMQSIIISLVVVFIYYAIYYPVFFAFGARIVLIIEYILAFALAIIPMLILSNNKNDPAILNKWFHYDYSYYWLAVIGLLVIAISWLISNFVYNRRNI